MNKKKPKSNMESPNMITKLCSLTNLEDWLQHEFLYIKDEREREILAIISKDIHRFVIWPEKAALLWDGCIRMNSHKYPEEIKHYAKRLSVYLDGRPNSPAVASFCIAGGRRPARYGSNNSWSIHHIYSGKFPYVGKQLTTHASKEAQHFTQSAGLVAVQPIADAMCDEYPAFTWYLRACAYSKFGYDPDGVFYNGETDRFGFANDFTTEIIYS